MSGSRSTWQRLRARLVGGMIAPGLLAVAGEVRADGPLVLPPADPHPAVVQPAKAPVWDLAACRALALEKQSAIAAARASLAAALARKQAIDNLKVPTFLQRDLPTRRKQACVGVSVQEAGVLQAEIDTIYAVQYAYVSYMYAKTQDALAAKTLERIKGLQDAIAEQQKAAAGEQKAQAEAKVEALALLADGRRQEAAIGVLRALSSLREAIGLGDECLTPPDVLGQFNPHATVDPKLVVQLALSHRPEIIQSALGADVSDLEICAQHSRLLSLSVWTFAAGSDIHANPLPSPVYGPGYRPGAIGPEMPVTLNGKRCDRVEQAQIYNGRAHNVAEKTQNLIRLEAEQACLRWLEASTKLVKYTQGVKKAQRALPDVKRIAQTITPAGLTANLDTARLLTDLRFAVNRARYEMLLALIGVERATAGAFCAALDKAPIVVEPLDEPLPKKEEANDK